MQDMSAVLAADACTRPQDGLWDTAMKVIDRHVLRHLEEAGMAPADAGIAIREGEQADRPGRPALQVTIGTEDVRSSTWIDWNGHLSWGRYRTWLDRRVLRQIARRRWILAMEKEGMDPLRAPFDRRSVDPLLRVPVASGLLSMDVLIANGCRTLSSRCAIAGGSQAPRSTFEGDPCLRIALPEVPEMEIRIDYDRVLVERLALSTDVVFRRPEDGAPTVRLGKHRLPHTALFSLAGRPLRELVDSPMLHPEAMPVIDRMRVRRNGGQEAVLRCGSDGALATEDLHA